MTINTIETILTEMVFQAERERKANDFNLYRVYDICEFDEYEFEVWVGTDGTIPVVWFRDEFNDIVIAEDFQEAITMYQTAYHFGCGIIQ